MGESPAAERILQYHDRTKHYPMRFARSLGYLDWANQPNPFRKFKGARKVLLPIDSSAGAAAHQNLYAGFGRGEISEPLTIKSLGRFFELSLGITAWKSYESSRWALRANPSSGNLHPTEGYVILPAIPEIGESSGVYHYRSVDHALEERCKFTKEVFTSLARGFVSNTFFVGLTSIHWREAWKYGERAFRYCQHDVGHAIGSLQFAAAALGWRFSVLSVPSDDEVSDLLGLSRKMDFEGAELEQPDLIGFVQTEPGTAELNVLNTFPPDAARLQLLIAPWSGIANILSADHVEWDAIDAAAAAAQKPRTVNIAIQDAERPPEPGTVTLTNADTPAATLIRQRRSATAFDAKTPMARDAFMNILDATLPRWNASPFCSISDMLDLRASVHLAIFVHRVEGLEPGIYFLLRDAALLDRIRAATRPAFEWKRVDNIPDYLPFYLLKKGDMRGYGASVSCNQDIAGDGAFSLGMICDFENNISKRGAHFYRYAHWEAGLVGQVLYLEAEAAGFRGTGIGCFYDDEVHGLLGIKTHEWHTIYHFACGMPVDDPRLQTGPGYTEGARLLTD
ncbi:MAG: SagB/ThcOx family dehydrogenase [Planctomycetota bacterium]